MAAVVAGAAAPKLGYRPGLDQLRGAAVLIVMVAHTFRFTEIGWAGAVGVWIFFVLSGFLITRLLVEERERHGSIARRAFYSRRARRLLPALPLAILFMVVINAALGVSSTAALVGTVTYTTNLLDITRWMGAFGGMWSLAIEEQFYLVWPLLVAAVAPRRLAWLAATGAVVVWLARWQLAPNRDAAYLATWFRADALLAGAALAVWWPKIPRPSRHVTWVAAVVVGLFGLESMSAGLLGWGGGAVTLACVVLVIQASHSTVRRPMLEYAGRRSYGLYLFHGPLALLLTERGAPTGWVILMIPVAFALAELSWRVIESRHLVGRRELHDVVRGQRGGERCGGESETIRRAVRPGVYDVHAPDFASNAPVNAASVASALALGP